MTSDHNYGLMNECRNSINFAGNQWLRREMSPVCLAQHYPLPTEFVNFCYIMIILYKYLIVDFVVNLPTVPSCMTGPKPKKDCGWKEIDQKTCEKRTCCWAKPDDKSTPWCYVKDLGREYSASCEFRRRV